MLCSESMRACTVSYLGYAGNVNENNGKNSAQTNVAKNLQKDSTKIELMDIKMIKTIQRPFMCISNDM